MNRSYYISLGVCLLLNIAVGFKNATAQPRTDAFLKTLLEGNKDSLFREVLRNPDRYRLQVIYTRIDRDKTNKPSFTHYYFNYDPSLYFNPASMVKLPLAVLALEKLNGLKGKGINKYTTLLIDSSQSWQHPLYRDTSALTGQPSIAHFIKRALLISENDPYNRLYQFIGQQGINRSLHQKGYTESRITRQFLGLTPEQNRHTNAMRFVNKQGETLYYQPPAYNTDSFDFSRTIKLGKAHWNSRDSLINEPFDFTAHNNLSLQTLQQVLQSVLFPQSLPLKRRFNLSPDDYNFLKQYLSQFPAETPDPKYDTAKFYDSYVKFFFADSTRRLPEGVRVFNKVGWAYGFATDVSYIADFGNGVEYMLAATIYVNKDETLNDGKYEYETVSQPFLYQLGQTIYRHEKGRKRVYKPNLSAFKIRYEKRDPADKRAPLAEVDN